MPMYFTVREGPQGPQGPEGPEGPQGPAGPTTIIAPVSGSFLIDPAEINGFGSRGWNDEAYTIDLGDTGATSLARIFGGYIFPFDVKLKRFYAYHRNNSALVEAWGWVVASQTKDATTTTSSNGSTTYIHLHEVNDNGGVGPRNYGSTISNLTDISFDVTIPAFDTLGIAVDAPTAAAANYYVDIMSGFLELELI